MMTFLFILLLILTSPMWIPAVIALVAFVGVMFVASWVVFLGILAAIFNPRLK